MSLRVFRQWLLQPLQDKAHIKYRTNMVSFYADNMPLRQIFSSFLRKMPDINKLLIKLFKVFNRQRNGAQLSDCYKLYRIVCELETLDAYLVNLGLANQEESLILPEQELYSKNMDFLKTMISRLLRHFEKYQEFIEKSLDIKSIETKREYLLNPGKLINSPES